MSTLTERITPQDTGRWLITTQGSEHTWDLDAMTAVRHQIDGANPFTFDGQTIHITEVITWPVVGDVFRIRFVEHRQGMRSIPLQSSTIRSIERLNPAGASADEEPLP